MIFLHKIKRGGADRSFGIEVARLAGLPEALLGRARALLTALESSGSPELREIDAASSAQERTPEQKQAVDTEKVLRTLRNIDVNVLTPIEAISILSDIVSRVQR